MGTERLSRGLAAAVVLLLAPAATATALGVAVSACASAPRAEPPAPRARTRHVQVVPAMKTSERYALVARFRAKNPVDTGAPWIVDEDALERSVVIVEPFRGFLRRMRRSPASGSSASPALAPSPSPSEDAADLARAFVRRNADVLGLLPAVVLGLGQATRRGESPTWIVHFDGRFASKGYEAHRELDNVVDIEVVVDDGGQVRSFANLSQIHPRLDLDTHPDLAEDDARVIAKLLGRRVFAVVGDDLDPLRPTPPGDLPRLALGRVEADDILRVTPTIHRSEGIRLAWVTYRLAYEVVVGKAIPEGGAGLGPPVYFFRYIVDADTGDVLEDARAPLSASPVESEP